MTKLSVNINKIATLRNARGGNMPNLLKTATDIENFGGQGITIHPRPEFNIEGNPIPKFIDLVLATKPDQVTLVPDAITNITSDAGWDTIKHKDFLSEVITEFKRNNIRTSIFIDPCTKMIDAAKNTGTDRIELYTEDYAKNFPKDPNTAIKKYIASAEAATSNGLGINAGHDLSLDNIEFFKQNIPNLLEVSIGHALICESLYLGLENVVQMYLRKLQ